MQQRRGGAGIPALQVLRNADFRTLWFFGASAEVARRWELLTLSWFVLQETDSALQLGLPWVFHNLPRPLFGAFFGALADRYGRRSLLMLAQTINALTAVTILALFVSDVMQPWHAFVAAFFSGTSRTLEDPARRTSTFDIVGPRRLVNAISLETLGSTVGRMTGYLMAGGMISLLAFEGAYGLVLGIHLLALSLLLRVKIPAHAPGDKGREPFLKGLKEAMRFAAGNPMLKGVLYASIMMNLLVFPFQQYIPAVGRDHLGAGPALVGLLVAADAFGRLGASAVLSNIRNISYHGRLFVAGALTIILLGILFAWSPWYVLAFAFLIMMGVGQASFMTVQASVVMLSSPAEMRGSMVGLSSFCIGVGIPVGTLAIGAMADILDARWGIFISLSAGLVLCIPAVVLTPLLKQKTAESLRPGAASRSH